MGEVNSVEIFVFGENFQIYWYYPFVRCFKATTNQHLYLRSHLKILRFPNLTYFKNVVMLSNTSAFLIYQACMHSLLISPLVVEKQLYGSSGMQLSHSSLHQKR